MYFSGMAHSPRDVLIHDVLKPCLANTCKIANLKIKSTPFCYFLPPYCKLFNKKPFFHQIMQIQCKIYTAILINFFQKDERKLSFPAKKFIFLYFLGCKIFLKFKILRVKFIKTKFSFLNSYHFVIINHQNVKLNRMIVFSGLIYAENA